MESIKLKAHVGSDGLLKLEVPLGILNSDLEVLVVVQALPADSLTTPANIPSDKKLSPEELGWPPGFFEQTAGALADDPLIIGSEGDYEVREELA